MIALTIERLAAAGGLEVVREGAERQPERAEIDSRRVRSGDLFFGIPGTRVDGGEFVPAVLAAGAWGAVCLPQHARAAAREDSFGWILSSPDPLRSLQGIAREWRRALGARVVGITGSTGKTSVKDLTRGLLPFRVHASPENFNTEIGLPLAILGADPDTEVLVLEMAMRGMGQIAELCAIAEPEIAAITNVGPVHLELLGTLDAIAEAKAEILGGLTPEGRAVVPVDADALEPHLADSLSTLTFGPGGDVLMLEQTTEGRKTNALVGTPAGEAQFDWPFAESHNLTNGLAAIAIGIALGAPVDAMARRAPDVTFSRLRGEHHELPGGITLVNDCYNANPISMHAALESLAAMPAGGKRIAVLGGMAELGPDAASYHREASAHARGLGIGPIVGVGDLAHDYAPDEWVPAPAAAVPIVDAILADGDVVLVKGSRSVGLEHFTDELIGLRRG